MLKEVEAYVNDVKKSWATTGCTIMFHVDLKSVVLYAYCPKGAIFLNLYEISRNGSIDVDFKNIVASVIKDIGVEHVVQFITNDASAFCLAGELLDSDFPKIYKVRCVADMLHHLFKDIYEKVGWVKSVIDYAKLIVDYIYNDGIVLSLMKQCTNGRELKHPCVNKFASNYQMLQTVLQNEKGLQQLVASVEWGSLDSNKTEKAAEVASIITDPGFWREGQEAFKALEPLIQVLCIVEVEGGTSGYLYAAMKNATEAIGAYCSNNNCKYTEAKMILELFEERRKYIVHPIHGAAAFLNPSYMCHENFEEDCDMKDGICFMIEKMVAGKERKKFAHEVQLYRNKRLSLFTVEAKEMLEVYHPCVWWEYYGNSVPVLQKYALQILSQPCKCLWEHKFSQSEVAQTKKIDAAELQTKMNVKLMEKFRTLQADIFVPMDLEKIYELPDYGNPDHERIEHEKTLRDKSNVLGPSNELQLTQLDDKALNRSPTIGAFAGETSNCWANAAANNQPPGLIGEESSYSDFCSQLQVSRRPTTASSSFFQSSSNTISMPPQYMGESRTSEDGYNWREFGQKQVEGRENLRSYYGCAHPDCPTEKMVERTLDGQITAKVYKGWHKHSKPQSTTRSSSSSKSSYESFPPPALAKQLFKVGQKRLRGEVGVAQIDSPSNMVYGRFGEIRSFQANLSSSDPIVGETAAEETAGLKDIFSRVQSLKSYKNETIQQAIQRIQRAHEQAIQRARETPNSRLKSYKNETIQRIQRAHEPAIQRALKTPNSRLTNKSSHF